MSEQTALLAAICQQPREDTPRLVYADWLQENGQEQRAEFIRLQCAIARRPELMGCTDCSATWCPTCGDCCCPDREESMCDHRCPLHAPDSLHDAYSREQRLFNAAPTGQEVPNRIRWIGVENPSYTIEHALGPHYERGFIELLACKSHADFAEYAADLFRHHPIERVTLDDVDCGDYRYGHDGTPTHNPAFQQMSQTQRVWPERWREMRYAVPDGLFAIIDEAHPQWRDKKGNCRNLYPPTRAEGMNALAAACVQWGERQAELATLSVVFKSA